MCVFIYRLQAIDINEPLDISFKDANIHVLEVIYPKKCDIEDKAFFVLGKEAVTLYFQNAELYDGESPVGVRDYPNYQCEIVGKFYSIISLFILGLIMVVLDIYIMIQLLISQYAIAKIVILVLL